MNRNIKSPAQSEVFRRTMGRFHGIIGQRLAWKSGGNEREKVRMHDGNRDSAVFSTLREPITDRLKRGIPMAREGIEGRETGFYIAGSRVPIDRIVWEYRNGEDPETIRSHYPTLSLEQVNEAITFYHCHKEEVEQAMEERRRAEDAYVAANPNPSDVKQRFERMRRQTAPRRI